MENILPSRADMATSIYLVLKWVAIVSSFKAQTMSGNVVFLFVYN